MTANERRALSNLAKPIRIAIVKMAPPREGKRPKTMALCEALRKTRPLLEATYGGPIYCRYSGCAPGPRTSYSEGRREFRVLEYLWDFSFSRHAIPQAIEALGATPMREGKFELLLVAESELGTADEICRDLLKLLEARAPFRCLVYREPKRSRQRHAFEARLIRVLHNHRHFASDTGSWLFIGLNWSKLGINCAVRSLNDDLTEIVLLDDGANVNG